MLLDIQYIPQKPYLIDGELAYKSGEWLGSKGSHWNSSLKVINHIRDASVSNPNPSLPLLGRRHFTEKRGKEMDEFSRKKLIKLTIKPEKSCIKHIIFKPKEEKEYKKNKISTPGKSNNEAKLFTHSKRKFKEKLYPDFKLIEQEFGCKRKINTVEERRNGLPVMIPGDNLFKNPEWTENFFQKGGLVVGSTNRWNHNKTERKGNNNFYETLDLKIQTLDPKKLWTYKINKEDLDGQLQYVKGLEVWEESIFGKEPEEVKKEVKPKDIKQSKPNNLKK